MRFGSSADFLQLIPTLYYQDVTFSDELTSLLVLSSQLLRRLIKIRRDKSTTASSSPASP